MRTPSASADKLLALDVEPPDVLTEAEQRMTIALVSRRLLPVCWLSALLAYLDRANLSFAALQMNDDLGAWRHSGHRARIRESSR